MSFHPSFVADPTFRRVRATITAVVCALFVAACSDGPTESKPQPGLHFVSGASGSDTIEANLSQPLILELRDDASQPIANRAVLFNRNTLPNADATSDVLAATITFDAVNTSIFPAPPVTDANGRITAHIRLGSATGKAVITAIAAGLPSNITDTATYTVRPGAPARVTLRPRDTTIYPAARLEFRTTTRDRFRNATTAAVAVSYITTNDLTVSSGGIATPRNAGRDTIVARVGAYADTVMLTVLPITGTLAATIFNSGTFKPGIATMNLDGSGYKEYGRTISTTDFITTYPRWSVDKKSIFASVQIGTDLRLWTVPLDGSAPFKSLVGSTLANESFPSPSLDGQWLYFHGSTAARPNDPVLFRARVDGTNIQALAPETPLQTFDIRNLQPAVSASGEWVAYTGTGGTLTNVRNVVTGVRNAFNRPARSPTWAPSGTRLAYINEIPAGVYTSEPDGSDVRVISLGAFSGPLSWTADGRYILARRTDPNYGPTYYELIEVATGARFKLALNIGDYAVLKPYN